MSSPSAEQVETVRVAVYASFAKTGRAATIPDLAKDGLSPSLVRQAVVTLHKSRSLVLSEPALASYSSEKDDHDTDPRAIVIAHPFATIPLGFSVMGANTLWWGGCAWDSFALPFVIPSEQPMLVATTCPGCHLGIAMRVSSHSPPLPEDVITRNGSACAHFLVPAKHMWDDVVHTCAHQQIFCDPTCLDSWLRRTNKDKGYVMTIETLWNLASGWYAGRLERGYKRREPEQAKEYFRNAGLQGSFWGL